MKTTSNAVLKKAQETHDKECPCGTTDTNEIGPWVYEELRHKAEQQYYTWTQSKNSRPRIMENLQFWARNFLRRG